MTSTRSSSKKNITSDSNVANSTTPKLSKKKAKIVQDHNVEALQDIAHLMRINSIEMCDASKSGHPTSCSSMAELVSVIFFDEVGMHYDPKNPKLFTNDRFVLSKGHGAPLLYAAWAHAGFLNREDLLNLRKFTSDLEGHPTLRLPFVDVATGSLGQGLSVSAGMAYSSKYLDKINNTYFCLMGDGEIAEGSIWEAANFASYYKLDNLIGIVDVNKLGQSGPTMLEHDMKVYQKRWQSFGWNAIVVNGHDILEIIEGFEKARNHKGSPSVILGETIKGKYMGEKIEGQLNWHGKPLGTSAADSIAHIKTLIKNPDAKLEPKKPDITEWNVKADIGDIKLPDTIDYDKGKDVATRASYGLALKKLGQSDHNHLIVGLDGDTKNSTMAETFQKAFPDNFIDCFIAEQNVVGVAQGLSCRGKIPFASAFGAFFTRAFDQIRMGAISGVNVKYVGSHAGVSIGEDGPSQMALEDLAMFRSIPNSVVFYPSDGISCERAIELAATHKGSVYVRTSRPATPIIYENTEKFEIGRCKLIKKSENDVLTIVTSGVTLHESIKAIDNLKNEGIHVRLIDLFCIKPIDKNALITNISETQGKLLCIEDHYPEGGLSEAVISAVADQGFKAHTLAVHSIPRSGKAEELLDFYNLSAQKIQDYVKKIM